MRQIFTVALFIAAVLGNTAALAHLHTNNNFLADLTSSTPPPGLEIRDCWIRAMPPQLPSAAYMRMENNSDTPLTLHGARSDAYAYVMLHTTTTHGGMAKMEHTEKLTIPAGKSLELSPGSHHFMLEQATLPLQIGESVPFSFWFGDSLVSTTDCIVKPANTLK